MPHVNTKFEIPLLLPTAPPDPEVYVNVDDKQISRSDATASKSIYSIYYIRNSFLSFAKLDCILDGGQYEDCTTIKCEDPNSYIPNPRGTVMKGYSEKSMIIFLPVEKFL